MAKKKNQSKKHRFKYTEAPTESATAVGTPADEAKAKTVSASVRPSQDSERDFSYVSRDLRRIAVLAVCLVLLEVGLAYMFNHTGLGSTVDNLIKL